MILYFCILMYHGFIESHLIDIKIIFRYYKGTNNFNLLYKILYEYKFVGFNDAYYIGDIIENKSTIDNYKFLREKSYITVKQDIINQCNINNISYINNNINNISYR